MFHKTSLFLLSIFICDVFAQNGVPTFTILSANNGQVWPTRVLYYSNSYPFAAISNQMTQNYQISFDRPVCVDAAAQNQCVAIAPNSVCEGNNAYFASQCQLGGGNYLNLNLGTNQKYKISFQNGNQNQNQIRILEGRNP